MVMVEQSQVWVGSEDSIIYILNVHSMSCSKQLTDHRYSVTGLVLRDRAQGPRCARSGFWVICLGLPEPLWHPKHSWGPGISTQNPPSEAHSGTWVGMGSPSPLLERPETYPLGALWPGRLRCGVTVASVSPVRPTRAAPMGQCWPGMCDLCG